LFGPPTASVTPSTSTAPYTPTSNLLSTNTSSFVGLNRIGSLPLRRYSYSGLPSSGSMTDSLNLVTQDSSITNLINETCQSISRSSNILNRQLSADMAQLGSVMSLSNLIDENIESDIVKYDLLNDITTTASNVMPIKYTNFYSQPTIATRSYTATHPHFNRNPLISDDYLLAKPIFSKNYNSLTSSYINDDYYTTPQYNHYTHNHYASNPCLSSHSYPYHSHHTHPSSSSSTFNRNYYQSHHQQPPTFSSSRPPSISSLNRYAALSNNYSSSFNAQPYYRTSSRIDLDNPKNSEIKRQVSFKFDVDQMSFDP
jgi:hypothetical protein